MSSSPSSRPIKTSHDLNQSYSKHAPLHSTPSFFSSSTRNQPSTSSSSNNNPPQSESQLLSFSLSSKLPTISSLSALLLSSIPLIKTLKTYNKSTSLRTDITAGLVIGFMLIPQGMAYGSLAGLPVEYGLHSSIFPQLLYMIFGTSTHLSFGTNAPISILVASSVADAVNTDTTCSDDTKSDDCELIINSTLWLSIITGVIYLVFKILRFSVITSLVPDPVLSGFTTGASVIIISSNMKHALGFKVPDGNVYTVWKYILSNLDQTNGWSVVIFITAFISLFGMKHINVKYKDKLKVPIPEQLVVLLIATFLVSVSYLDVPTVGYIPAGLYSWRVPTLPPNDVLQALFQSSITCAIVTYILTVNVGKSLGDKYGYKVNADQEFVALSICSVLGGITGSALPSGSFSRSALVGDISPHGTSLHNLFSTVVVMSVLALLTPALKNMPNAIMASIIFAALKNMINITTARLLYKASTPDFALWMVAFLGTAVLGVTYGIGASIVAAVTVVLRDAAYCKARVLGRVGVHVDKDKDKESEEEEDEDESGRSGIWLDIKQYPSAKEIPGVKVFSFEGNLTFVNKDHFEERLKKMEDNHYKTDTDSIDDTNTDKTQLHTIILDLQSTTLIDYTSLKLLHRLNTYFQSHPSSSCPVQVLYANLRITPSIEQLFGAVEGGWEGIGGRGKCFFSIDDAVEYGRECFDSGREEREKKKEMKDKSNGSVVNVMSFENRI